MGNFVFKKKFLSFSSFTPKTNGGNVANLSAEELSKQLLLGQHPSQQIVEPESPKNVSKRLRVSDLETSRYHEEFVELSTLSEGSYGIVYVAKNRLDGITYALKVYISVSIT